MNSYFERMWQSMKRAAPMAGGLAAFAFMVDKNLCKHDVDRVVQKRRHRTKRINKKWWKRYGARFFYKPCPGVAYRMFSTFYLCPCVAAQLEKEVARDGSVAREVPPTVGPGRA